MEDDDFRFLHEVIASDPKEVSYQNNIRQRPLDKYPRLAYAEWLDGQGRTASAAMVREGWLPSPARAVQSINAITKEDGWSKHAGDTVLAKSEYVYYSSGGVCCGSILSYNELVKSVTNRPTDVFPPASLCSGYIVLPDILVASGAGPLQRK